eukprot:jgi/Mesvir1/4273/Mv22233-RA.1
MHPAEAHMKFTDIPLDEIDDGRGAWNGAPTLDDVEYALGGHRRGERESLRPNNSNPSYRSNPLNLVMDRAFLDKYETVKHRWERARAVGWLVGGFGCVLLAAILLSVGVVVHKRNLAKHMPAPPVVGPPPVARPRNVILMISDGMGPGYVTLARNVMRQETGGSRQQLLLDTLLRGMVSTRSLDSLVTDSAAAATAYATGFKAPNHYLAMGPGDNATLAASGGAAPMPTILEAAEAAGLWTGLVTNTRITHATPAAFSSHVDDRDNENEVAAQQLLQGIEVLMGGGLQFLIPNTTAGSLRTDGRDILKEAQERFKYTIARSEDDLNLNASVPFWGVFSDSHMAYSIDRARERAGDTSSQLTAGQPTLAAMVRKALQLLADAPKGFFLMVEGGLIDHAGHANDAATAAREVLAYDVAVTEALAFASARNDTLLLSTSDHETGGLSIGCCNVYEEKLEGLLAQVASADQVAEWVLAEGTSVERALTLAGLNASSLQPDALLALQQLAEGMRAVHASGEQYDDPYAFPALVGVSVSSTLEVGFTTAAHTGVDVPLYAYGPGCENFTGWMDNTEVGRRMVAQLQLESYLSGLK